MIELDEEIAATMQEKAAAVNAAIKAIHAHWESTYDIDNVDWNAHRLDLAGLHGTLMGTAQAMAIYVEVYCK